MKNKGITLIALVVTIVVLLILAGITIGTLTSDNGVIKEAVTAKEKAEKAEVEEQIEIAILEAEKKYRNPTLDNVINELINNDIIDTKEQVNTETGAITSNLGYVIKGKLDDYGDFFDAEEWDKTAAEEDYFIWGSDTEGQEGYDVIVGYTSNLEGYTKLRIPSRCKKIEIGSTYTNTGSGDSRSFCSSVLKIEMPKTITEIGAWSFSSGDVTGFDSLESVKISSGVTKIGESAFNRCTKLSSITIPSSVTSIGDFAFYGCTSLSNITIPSSVTSIGNSAFRECTSLSSITIPSSVTSIGGEAFMGCTSLSSITIPSSVTSLGYGVFYSWTSSQTINIQGYTSDSAPSGWDSNWKSGCLAIIKWNQ